jgi:hypothetical protein
MKKLLFSILFLCTISAFCQEVKPKETAVEFYGFVRLDAYMDTYKSVDAGHDMFYLLPKYSTVAGLEANKQRSSQITPVASRLGVKVNLPEIFKAKVTGLFEFDFAGNLKTDPTLFRILQANSVFTWQKSSLLLGQTWHPFFGGSCVPVVAGINTGAPFNCFNRSPMIRYNMIFKGLTVSISALSEIQYVSPMMEDNKDLVPSLLTPNHAKRNGVVPELVLSAEWTKNTITLGAGAEYKVIKPRMIFTGTNAQLNSISNEFLNSTAFMGYGRYKKNKLMVLAKGVYGDNMSHLTLPGGYGVATYDAASGKETYTSYRTFVSMMNIVYGQKYQIGLFVGYGKNLGTNDTLNSFDGKAKTKGLFTDMQNMYRVAPHISLNLSKFKLIAEYENTVANYGIGAINLTNGLYDSTHKTANSRFIIAVSHFF